VNLEQIAKVRAARGRPGEAKDLLREAVDVAVRVYGDDHLEVARLRLSLGRALVELQDTGAEATLGRCAASLEDQLGADDWRPSIAHLWLGRHLADAGRLSEAAGLFESARDRRRRTLEAGDARILEAELAARWARTALGETPAESAASLNELHAELLEAQGETSMVRWLGERLENASRASGASGYLDSPSL
ncbi:MAG: tetratricopeptide repeat protein, partial [Acidobacteriota bacterium]